ncbi:hypothetical protein [Methanococcoides sp. FTZ1]|uniref:hypothetical protein n=1 Tax=Methanococcoides sp. FTZ1 TaxID=3439061 RepID=UPI003F868194
MSTDKTTDLNSSLSDQKRKSKQFWDKIREEIDERREQSQEKYKNWINKSFLGTNEEKEVGGSKLSAYVDEFFQRSQDRHDQNLKLGGGGRPNAAGEIPLYSKIDTNQGFDESGSEIKPEPNDGSKIYSYQDPNVDALVEDFNLDSDPESGFDSELDLFSDVESGFDSELDLFSDVESGFDSELDLFSDVESGFDSELDLFSEVESGFDSELDLFSEVESGFDSELDLFSDVESGFDSEVDLGSDVEDGSGNESNIFSDQVPME